MDINYLLKREQVSLMQAKRAPCSEARIAHEELVRCYGVRLSQTTHPHATVAIAAKGL